MMTLAFFLAPAALALLALLPLIVLMYLLKLRRQPQRVPSTLLWQRAVQDLVANAPFQRLRNNLLLWLQLLILTLLIFALARPIIQAQRTSGESVIVMIDLSASMQSIEADGRTRLQLAKERALQEVEALRGAGGAFRGRLIQDEMMVIGFAHSTFPLQSMTTDRAALRNAILAAEAFDTEADLSDALLILREKTMTLHEGDAFIPRENVRVILLSDGNIGPTVDRLTDIPHVDFILIGQAADNVGIVQVDVRESFVGQRSIEIFATLLNDRSEPHDALLRLSTGNQINDVRRVRIPAGGEASTIFTVEGLASSLATLELVDHRDSFPLDDRVELLLDPPTDIRVQLITRGNPFLRSALEIDPRVSLRLSRPGAPYPPEAEIFVHDGTTPETLLPGTHLFVNALPPAAFGFREEGEPLRNPRVVDWDRLHPLTRFASFDSFPIAEARRIALPPGAIPILKSTETDLIVYHETETHRILLINFDITRSFWPLDVSFPIFMNNMIDHFSRLHRKGRAINRTGTLISLPAPPEATEARLRNPRGEVVDFSLDSSQMLYITEANRAGLHEIRFTGSPLVMQLPVALLSVQESRTAPIAELQLGGRTLSASQTTSRSPHEVWFWLALVALGVLMAEWILYCRRTFM